LTAKASKRAFETLSTTKVEAKTALPRQWRFLFEVMGAGVLQAEGCNSGGYNGATRVRYVALPEEPCTNLVRRMGMNPPPAAPISDTSAPKPRGP
jgi:hypothetical protein